MTDWSWAGIDQYHINGSESDEVDITYIRGFQLTEGGEFRTVGLDAEEHSEGPPGTLPRVGVVTDQEEPPQVWVVHAALDGSVWTAHEVHPRVRPSRPGDDP